jgi:mitogen-activated protein kinase kinase kinase
MAMLASKSSFPASLGSSGSTLVGNTPTSNMPPTRRALAVPSSGQGFASPTESEFSDADSPDAVKNWNEDQVADYLRSVKCGEYEKLFRKNHINGENLLEMDKEVLKEMGIDKVGDRVRLFLGIKKLRTKTYANVKKRNRVSVFSFFLSFSSTSFPAPFACVPRRLFRNLNLT